MSELTTRLGREPAWRLVPRFVGLAEQALLRRFALALGLRAQAVVDCDSLTPPDSELCRKATDYVASVSPLFLLNHGVRSYVFGAALGHRDGQRFDPELLYLACVMHDLGLTDKYAGEPEDFELVSARHATSFLREQGLAEDLSGIVHEAIALHARIGTAMRAGPEAALTHLGAGMDVIGVRAEDFRPEDVERTVEAWPRENFKACFSAVLCDQARNKPLSNIAGHVGLGFTRRIASAPFHD
jgi:hypothetical protein